MIQVTLENIKAYFIECSGEVWQEIILQLQEQQKWQTVCWSGDKQTAGELSKQLEECVFHIGTEATKGGDALNPSEIPILPLDRVLLEKLSSYEAIALHMMDRMDASGADFTHEERRRHFYDLARYWHSRLMHDQPDVVVFSISPHIIYDYVLYGLCKIHGIPTIMFERTGLPGWVFLTNAITGKYGDAGYVKKHSELNEDYKGYLDKAFQGGASAIPPNFKKKMAQYKLNHSSVAKFVHALVHEFLRFGYLFKKHGFQEIPNTYLKRPNIKPIDSKINVFSATATRYRAIFKKRKLLKYLEKQAHNQIPRAPYVLLALHYQPERATVPMAGMFGDQLLVVDMLARSLPEDWILCVKEHPWQLQSYSRGEMQRTKEFYDQVRSYANVQLVSPSTDMSSLLEQAMCVATSTGSIGWQAICRSKPALVFGAAWYRYFPGAYRIETSEDCRKAFEVAIAQKDVSYDVIYQELLKVQNASVPGVLEPNVESASVSVKIAADGMVDEIVRFFKELKND